MAPDTCGKEETEQELVTHLSRCALNGAKRVTFILEMTTDGQSASLTSRDAQNNPIGDDRDYDLLKACFDPLRRLTEQYRDQVAPDHTRPGQKTTVSFDIETGRLDIDFA